MAMPRCPVETGASSVTPVRHIRHVHHTCACNHGERCKENKPVAAKSSNYIMKGRGIDAFFAAEAAIQKHHEHIPTYRMERRLRNANTNLTRQGIGKCVSHLALGHLEPLRQVLLTHVKAGAVVHADETPIRVQAPGKGKCATGYIWALCRDERNWNPEAQPAVFYEYNPSRAGTVIEGLLSDARCQFLLTDGYAGYNRLFAKEGANDGLVSARCWAHARRAFFEAFLATKSKLSEKIVRMIRKMYAVEKAARGLPAEVRLAMRQDKTLPILAEIRSELVKAEPKVQGSVKKAVSYTLNAFDALRCFSFDGCLEIDNNPVERCIRGIALDRGIAVGRLAPALAGGGGLPGNRGIEPDRQRAAALQRVVVARPVSGLVGRWCGSAHPDRLPRWIHEVNPSQNLCNRAVHDQDEKRHRQIHDGGRHHRSAAAAYALWRPAT